MKYTFPSPAPEGRTDNFCRMISLWWWWIYRSGAKLSTLQYGAKSFVVPNCLFFITVPNCPRCQIVHGVKLSTVPNCPRCQIVRGAKLSTLHCGVKLSTFRLGVPNRPLWDCGAKLSWCQIVDFYTTVPNCPGAKLSTLHCGAKLCTFRLGCQIVHF